MKRFFPCLLFFLITLAHFTSYSQNLTGIWRGYFTTENYDQYKFELQIAQKGNNISGVSYSYLTTVFYGKAALTGNFNKTGQSALIREIKTVEVRMNAGSTACIMKCIFQYARSGREEFLEGTFTSKFEKNTYGAKQGDNCGGGKVYLRKVTTSDFYIEPFLRGKIKTDVSGILPQVNNKKKDSVIKTPEKKNPSTITKKPAVTNKKPDTVKKVPLKKSPSVATKVPAKNKTKSTVDSSVKSNTNRSLTKINTPEKLITDTVKKIDTRIEKQSIEKQNIPIPDVLKNRENELVKTLVVNNVNVTVKLYDNGIVDGDSISVYYDKKLILANKGLSEAPLIIHLKMDEDNSEHELVMVALNEGRIPPNTALMTVESGDQRFDVHIVSTEQKNAVVRFRYQKPK